jgi:uncharacterized protein
MKKDNLRKKEYYGELTILYGKLFTTIIRRRLSAFYLEDFSISEIAQNEKVSRNAVFETISQGQKSLEAYEKALKLYERKQRILELMGQLETTTDEKQRTILLKMIKGEMDYGI